MCSDLAALAGQPALFGNLASVSTARRVLLSIGEAELDRVRQARAVARARAWQAGAAPERVILDFDATPITIHSEKEHAAGHYKGGFGFHPLLASCGREVLAGILRPGSSAANNSGDHLHALELALEQLPQSALDGPILARSDRPGRATTSRSDAGSAISGSHWAMRSECRRVRRSSLSERPRGSPRSTPMARHATAPGSASDRPGQSRAGLREHG